MRPGPASQSKKSALFKVFPPSRLIAKALYIVSATFLCVATGAPLLQAAPQQSPAPTAGPDSVAGVTVQMEGVVPYEFNGDLRNLPQLAPGSIPKERPALPVRHAPPSNKTGGAPSIGQQEQPSANILLPLTPAPSPTRNFAGMSSGDSCTGGSCGGGAVPPDPNGDVGPNHYIEAVNIAYAIYDKTGTRLAALTEDSLWSTSGSSTPCGNGNAAGDPVVVYDPLGDRWILAHIGSAFDSSNNPTPPFYECIAVSKTSDPVAGGWWFYALQMDPGGTGKPPAGTFNDYAKFGIWADCLYMSANGFNGAAFAGAMYASMSRSDLESGATLTWSLGYLSNATNTSPFTMIPGNLRGTPPPAGTPNYFVSESQAVSFAFDVRKFTAGPNCGGGGTLSGPANVSQTSYAAPPTVSVPQPGTSQLLDAIDDRMMQKVQYRRVGNTESLWVVHNVQVSSGLVQPQWAQLDVTGGTIATAPVQQQIYAPDNTLYRWMGSIAADKMGNVALGYSTSNGTAPNFPSIAYSGRLATDPLNMLPQTETQLIAGAVSQTGIQRWGDYSGMSVDPSDDCTFWYVNEYYGSQASGAGDWQTRIGSFKFPSCTASAVTLTLANVAFNNQIVGTTSATTNIQLTNSGSSTLNVTSIALTGTDPTQFTLVSPTNGSTSCSFAASSIAAGSSCSFGVQFAPNSAGSKSASVSVTDDASGSPQMVGLTGVGFVPAPAAALSPVSVPFGNQVTGTSSGTINLQLSNSGTATLNITSITLTGTAPTQFMLVASTSGSPACSLAASTITAGGSCFFGVQFTPMSVGSKSANVSVTDNASGSPQTVVLTGVGTPPVPAVTFNPASVPFPSRVAGTTSSTSNVQLTNSGAATLSITSIMPAGPDSTQFTLVAPTSGSPACSLGVSNISAGNSCFLGVQFAPTSAGTKNANVSVIDNASGSPQSIGLTGVATQPAPVVVLTPTTASFNAAVGMNTTSNVQLSNAGSVALNIASIVLWGADATQFMVVAPTSGSPTCSAGTIVNPGNSCFLGVRFAPTSVGAKNANVSVADNAADSPQPIGLTGIATQSAPVVVLTPASVSFNAEAGTTSTISNVQLSNTGSAVLNIMSITLGGTDATQFALVAPTSGSPACSLVASSINPNSSCFLGVQFKPTGTGPRNASISVADNASASPQATLLSGVGVDFSVAAAPPATATAAAGTNATFTVDLTTTGGATPNAITFSASGNPSATSVAFGPPSIPSGTAPSTTSVTMTVTTMRRSNAWPAARPFPALPGPASLYSILCLALGSALLFLKRKWLKEKKLIGVCSLGVVLLACAAFQGCARTQVVGGNGNPGGAGTPAGTSTITVTATAGSISRTTTVSLTVQ